MAAFTTLPISHSSNSRDDDPNILSVNGTQDHSYHTDRDVNDSTPDITELKTFDSSSPSQYLGVPPPPAFVNHFDKDAHTNDASAGNSKATAQHHS